MVTSTNLTGLDGTNGQIWVADGSGSGAWALPSPASGSVTNVGAGTNVLVTGTAQFPIINTDGNLQTGINLNSSTGATHTIQIAANVVTGAANTASISTLDGQVIKERRVGNMDR